MGVVNNYSDTSMTTWTLFENFEGFSQILQEQSDKKRYLGVFTHQIAIIEKFENCCIFRKFDYADTRFFNFAIEYLRENEKVRETVLAFSYGA